MPQHTTTAPNPHQAQHIGGSCCHVGTKPSDLLAESDIVLAQKIAIAMGKLPAQLMLASILPMGPDSLDIFSIVGGATDKSPAAEHRPVMENPPPPLQGTSPQLLSRCKLRT